VETLQPFNYLITMDEKLKPFEPLLEQIEIYGKTSIEVFRL
jgi:hypothetical protein